MGSLASRFSGLFRREQAPEKYSFQSNLFLNEPLLFNFTIHAQLKRLEKGAIIWVKFLDVDRREIGGTYKGLSRGKLGAYRYITIPAKADGSQDHAIILRPPTGARSVRIDVEQWKSEEPISLAPGSHFIRPDAAEAERLFDERLDQPEFLRFYAELCASRGDLHGQRKGLEQLGRLVKEPEAFKKLSLLSGRLRELSPDWLPTISENTNETVSRSENRICHLMKVCRPYEDTGGAVRNFYMVKSLRNAGLDPYVITPLGYPRNTGLIPESLCTMVDGTPHFHLDIWNADQRQWPLDRALELEVQFAAGIFRRQGGALINAVSGYRGYENALKGLALSKHFDVPLIYEVRSLHEHTWGQIRTDILDAPLTQMRIAQENRCMHDADHVVTITQAMKDLLVQRGLPPEKITVIPNATDGNFFLPPDDESVSRLRADLRVGAEKVIGYISNLSGREGHSVLLRAFAEISKRRRHLRCLIVGEGSERKALESLAKDLNIAEKVIFTGNVPHEDIKGYYRLIDIFVVPRIADYASDFVTPLKPFEALALERPLIMSDRPVAKEILSNEERGLTFRTADHEHLVSKLEELLDHPERAKALASAGQKWVRTERNWDSNARAYKALYGDVIDRTKPRRVVA